ncbi:GNAT family N-acetyltransferase [Streptomyces rimosus]|uniref:GNAT family N-acetyltransferase n=1 Tax=Streptomyces rimosus TaxID=1927 RepID=UPI00067CD195|nr:GNAT family protein [Streptomyces rimosus]
MSVADLLRTEIEVIWPTDGRGRFRGSQHMVISVSADGRHQVPAVADHLPDALAADLLASVAKEPAPENPGLPPPALPRLQHLLEAVVGPVHITSGPSYLIHPDRLRFTPTAPVVPSDTEDPAALAALRPANPGNWDTDEWHDLLDGKLGPWAMALDPADPARVVSICHTPCWTDHGAEAGTWTRPGHRGRGHAATVTAAWSRLQAPTGRHLFYSTSDTNRSSRNVAVRLGLAPLGHLWKLSPPASIAL